MSETGISELRRLIMGIVLFVAIVVTRRYFMRFAFEYRIVNPVQNITNLPPVIILILIRISCKSAAIKYICNK